MGSPRFAGIRPVSAWPASTVEFVWMAGLVGMGLNPSDGVAVLALKYDGKGPSGPYPGYLPLSTQPMAGPMLGSGSTIPGGTPWEPWSVGFVFNDRVLSRTGSERDRSADLGRHIGGWIHAHPVLFRNASRPFVEFLKTAQKPVPTAASEYRWRVHRGIYFSALASGEAIPSLGGRAQSSRCAPDLRSSLRHLLAVRTSCCTRNSKISPSVGSDARCRARFPPVPEAAPSAKPRCGQLNHYRFTANAF